MPLVAVSITGGAAGDLVAGSLGFTGGTGHGAPLLQNTNSTTTITLTGVAASSVMAAFLATGSGLTACTTGAGRYLANVSSSYYTGNSAGATNTGSGSVTCAWSGGGTTCAMLAVEVLNATFDVCQPGSSGASNSGSASLSWTHTPGAGFNSSGGVILVGVDVDASNDSILSCAVTYGGTPMTSLGKEETGSPSGSGYLQVFYLLVAGINTSPAWAASQDIAGSGTGSWTNPGNVLTGGGSSGPWATWTAP